MSSSRPSVPLEKLCQNESSAKGKSDAAELRNLTHHLKDKKIGQILVDKGLISLQQLSEALFCQKELIEKQQKQMKLGEILIFSEWISLADLQNALRSQVQKAEQSRQETKALKTQFDERKRERQEQIDQLRQNFAPKQNPKQRQSFLQNLGKKILGT